VTWHQFRHVHSSLLHDLGVPAKVAQQQLGHASVHTTLKVYTHVVETTHRKAIEDLERVLFPSVPKLASGAWGEPVCWLAQFCLGTDSIFLGEENAAWERGQARDCRASSSDRRGAPNGSPQYGLRR
jgi:integrase-like protein